MILYMQQEIMLEVDKLDYMHCHLLIFILILY